MSVHLLTHGTMAQMHSTAASAILIPASTWPLLCNGHSNDTNVQHLQANAAFNRVSAL